MQTRQGNKEKWNPIVFCVFKAVWVGWNHLEVYPGEIPEQVACYPPLPLPPTRFTLSVEGDGQGPERCPQARPSS